MRGHFVRFCNLLVVVESKFICEDFLCPSNIEEFLDGHPTLVRRKLTESSSRWLKDQKSDPKIREIIVGIINIFIYFLMTPL